MKRIASFPFIVIYLLAAAWGSTPPGGGVTPTPTLKPSRTPTEQPISTSTPVPPTASATLIAATVTPPSFPSASPTAVSGVSAPFPSAPLCADSGALHDVTQFHTLWDGLRGCHFDHEHGADPFTAEVAAAFPGWGLVGLLGGVEVGHTNPSSPAENTSKHGGMKWQVTLGNTCVSGFEGAQWCIAAAVIQYHAFGNLAIELNARIHSTVALLKICDPANLGDCGYLYAVSHQDYGQRVAPYQNTVLPYPDNPLPAYNAGLGPYWSLDCFGLGLPNCRASVEQVRSLNLNVNSTITSKGGRTGAQDFFNLLLRVRDNYQLLDSADLTHPFTFAYVCGGAVYAPLGCRWNNSTATVHEAGGVVPAWWDGQPWDTDARAGRVSGSGEIDGLPFIAVNLFVGRYGSELSAGKVSNPTPANTPERDIYFCGPVVCYETDFGAVPSGWIGPNN
jgi:hypothetical protein